MHQVNLSETQAAILKLLSMRSLSRKEIFTEIGMNGDSRSFKRHIEPLLTAGFIEMTVPDKPNSRVQKYRISAEGLKMSKV
jgi:predicted transcriptional regulator